MAVLDSFSLSKWQRHQANEQEVEQRLAACYHVLIVGGSGREGGAPQGERGSWNGGRK